MIWILFSAALLAFTHIILHSINILSRLVAETYLSGQLFPSKTATPHHGRRGLKGVWCFWFLFSCINFQNRLGITGNFLTYTAGRPHSESKYNSVAQKSKLDLVICHWIPEQSCRCLKLHNTLKLFDAGGEGEKIDFNAHTQTKHILMLDRNILMHQ